MSRIHTAKLRQQLTSDVDSLLERLYTSNDIYVKHTLDEFGARDLMELGEMLDQEIDKMFEYDYLLQEGGYDDLSPALKDAVNYHTKKIARLEKLKDHFTNLAKTKPEYKDKIVEITKSINNEYTDRAKIYSATDKTAAVAKSKISTAGEYIKNKAKQAVQFAKDQPQAAAVIGGAVVLAMGATALYLYLNRNSRKWQKGMQELNAAKAAKDNDKVAAITNKLRTIKANMAKADAALRKKVAEMTPEKRAEFIKKKSSMLSAAKERENLK